MLGMLTVMVLQLAGEKSGKVRLGDAAVIRKYDLQRQTLTPHAQSHKASTVPKGLSAT